MPSKSRKPIRNRKRTRRGGNNHVYDIIIKANVAEYDEQNDDSYMVSVKDLEHVCKDALCAHLVNEVITLLHGITIYKSCRTMNEIEATFRLTTNRSKDDIVNMLESLGEKSINSKFFKCGENEYHINQFTDVQVIKK